MKFTFEGRECDAGSCVLSHDIIPAKAMLFPAQLLHLNSSPAELVAAPGAGKVILPLWFAYRLEFGTRPYISHELTNLVFPGDFTVGADLGNWPAGPQVPFFTVGRDYFVAGFSELLTGIGGIDLAAFVNQPLFIKTLGEDMTDGDGVGSVWVRYEIFDLH